MALIGRTQGIYYLIGTFNGRSIFKQDMLTAISQDLEPLILWCFDEVEKGGWYLSTCCWPSALDMESLELSCPGSVVAWCDDVAYALQSKHG